MCANYSRNEPITPPPHAPLAGRSKGAQPLSSPDAARTAPAATRAAHGARPPLRGGHRGARSRTCLCLRRGFSRPGHSRIGHDSSKACNYFRQIPRGSQPCRQLTACQQVGARVASRPAQPHQCVCRDRDADTIMWQRGR
eukprot:5017697-Prymnesium_polylepis.2